MQQDDRSLPTCASALHCIALQRLFVFVSDLVESEDGVVDESVGAGHDGVHVDDGRASRGNRDRLDEATGGRHQVAVAPHFLNNRNNREQRGGER